jgi:hypothetical protein
MKNPTQPIISARTALLETRSALESSRALLASNKSRLEDAAVNSDITLEGVRTLREISTMRALAGILHGRIAAIQRQAYATHFALISAVDAFVASQPPPCACQLQA